MAKSIPAIVTPEVLQWARGLDKISVNENIIHSWQQYGNKKSDSPCCLNNGNNPKTLS